MKVSLSSGRKAKQRLGSKCPWSLGWLDTEGRRKSKHIGSKSISEKYARKMEGELVAGVYQGESRKPWSDFLREYQQKVAAGMSIATRIETLSAVSHFERLINPQKVSAMRSQSIADYVAKRRLERGLKRGSTVSPAMINKELRHLRAVLTIAHEWGYLPVVPRIRMVRELKKLPRYVTADHFAALYKACSVRRSPRDCHIRRPAGGERY